MRPPWSRRAPPPTPAAAMDALITLSDQHVPPGATREEALAAARDAAATVPGAAWISVEYHPFGAAAAAVQWVSGDAFAPATQAFRAALEAAVEAALRRLAGEAVGRPDPSPAAAPLSSLLAATPLFAARPPSARLPPGFAEAPMPLDGLSHAGLQRREAPDAASDTALLRRLLAHATGIASSAAAPRAIARFGSFARVLAAPERELLEIPGLGEHSVTAIKLAHAIILRGARAALMGQPVAANWQGLLAYLRAAIARERVEQFRVLFLDRAGRLAADEAQARGTVNHTPVYPREVVRRALELEAASLILAHNHPSGDPRPSQADFEMTEQVQAACRVVGLQVADHLIVATGSCFSFRESGLLGGS